MKIAIITVEPSGFVCKELVTAFQKAGHSAVVLNPHDAVIEIDAAGKIFIEDQETTDIDYALPRMSESEAELKDSFMEVLKQQGVKFFNSPVAMMAASDKIKTQLILSRAGIKMPKTIMVGKIDGLNKAVESLGGEFPLIVKTVKGTHGVGVVKVDSHEALVSVCQLLHKLGESFMLQQFVKHEESRRIMWCQDEVLAVINRTIPAGDFRSNAAQGSTLSVIEPTEAELAMAKNVAEMFDLKLSAIDYILQEDGTCLVFEVNGSPGFEAMQKVVDYNVAEQIVTSLTKGIAEASTNDNDSEVQIELSQEDKIKEDEEVLMAAEPEEDEVSTTDKIENDEPKNDEDEQIEIGFVVPVNIRSLDVDGVEARVDTGAKTSSIHADSVIINDDKISFDRHGTTYRMPLVREANIKGRDGAPNTKRPVIKLDLYINGKLLKDIEFTLVDRKKLDYEIIIGRNALADSGIIINTDTANKTSPEKLDSPSDE